MSFELNKAGTTDYPQVPNGTAVALPVQIVDFGFQEKYDFDTKETAVDDNGKKIYQHKVFITSEFPEHTMDVDGEQKPLWVGKEYTLSTHEKAALTGLISSTAPSAKNLTEILGIPYMATIESTSGGKAKIVATTPAADKLVMNDEMVNKADIKLINSAVSYSIEDGEDDVFKALPEWMQNNILEGKMNQEASS